MIVGLFSGIISSWMDCSRVFGVSGEKSPRIMPTAAFSLPACFSCRNRRSIL